MLRSVQPGRNKFYGERVGYRQLQEVLAVCIESLNELDAIKKTLFYGKGAPHETTEKFDCADIGAAVAYNMQAGEQIVHAIIGIATEAGELLNSLHKSIYESKSFDVINIDEEVGDVFWYQALLANACGFDFEASQRKNIAKLRMRYGEKFSEFDAINRNLKAERGILELNFVAIPDQPEPYIIKPAIVKD